MFDYVKENFSQILLSTLALVAVAVWYVIFVESQEDLVVAFLDVGQGDAALIDAPGGQQILIDGGPDRRVLSELSKIMPFYDRFIETVIATHPDKDHIGGLIYVLERYGVDFLVEPGVRSETAVYKGLENLIAEKGVKKVLAQRGMNLVFDNGARLIILFPDRDVSGIDTNDASIIAKLVYGNTSFLLTGDSSKKIERYLVSLDGKNLDVDVLKAGHHGSKTSSLESFVESASPEFTVISSGRKNRYGHPHQETLDILEKFGARILRTDLLGSIIMKSDGRNIWVE